MKFINSIGKAFSSLLSWVKSFLADADGEASSKRLSMLFLVSCLGFGFVASAVTHKDIQPSEHLTDAVVTVILFLAGFTNIDRAIKAFGNKKAEANNSTNETL
jgi:energy-converting hydrogenase Eha subunit C